jgi:hypothetical protein
VVVFGLAGLGAAMWPATGGAHKAITSKYTYHQHVLPILKERCGRCHRDGGIAPMSLLQYQEAMPWAEAMRGELLGNRMPPWNADAAFGSLKSSQSLSAQELDVLLTWASGGSPAGPTPPTPPDSSTDGAWPLGPPDLVLALPAATLPSDVRERAVEVTVPTDLKADRWIRAVDLQPGTPSIVRSAIVSVGSTPAAGTSVGTWLPGEPPVTLEGKAAYRLPVGSPLSVKVQYRKTWKNESDEVTDRSALGLYFASSSAAREVQRVIVRPTAEASLDAPLTFTHAIDRDLEAVAIRAEGGPADLSAQVVAVAPGGARTPLIRLVVRRDWPRQYAFAAPVRLVKGSRIEITTTPSEAALWESITGEPPAPSGDAGPLTLTLDTIAATRR